MSSAIHRYGANSSSPCRITQLLRLKRDRNCDLAHHKEAWARTDNLEPYCLHTLPEQHHPESFSMNYSLCINGGCVSLESHCGSSDAMKLET